MGINKITMELRKQKEAEFHDEIRDKKLEEDINKHKYLTSNRKFYSIIRKSDGFKNDFLIKNCLDKRVLDYCCGDGAKSILLAESGADVVGIDISSKSIQNCKEKIASKGLSDCVSFFVMDGEKMEFEDNYFDLITSNGVLHHLDIKKAYPELARVLKPDGKIICGEPLIYNPIFHLYRKITPHLRTEWEVNHILSRKDIKLAEEYFEKVETRFFHLATLLAVPFHNLSCFNSILGVLEKIDSVLLRVPLLKWWAWQIIFILSNPYGREKTKRN